MVWKLSLSTRSTCYNNHFLLLICILEHAARLDDSLSKRHLDLDPAGYFVIYLDEAKCEIVADHYRNLINSAGIACDPDTGKVIPCDGSYKPKPQKTYRYFFVLNILLFFQFSRLCLIQEDELQRKSVFQFSKNWVLSPMFQWQCWIMQIIWAENFKKQKWLCIVELNMFKIRVELEIGNKLWRK